MPFNTTDTLRYRHDLRARGELLSAEERVKLISRYLPPPESVSAEAPDVPPPSLRTSQLGSRSRRRIRPFLKNKLYALLFFLVHLVFGVYVRLRQIYHATVDRALALMYHHHRTPAYVRRDVKDLSRLPEHLSVILTRKADEDGGLEALADEVAELGAWSCAAGIPLLSVYERTGVLKLYTDAVHELVERKLGLYFGAGPEAPTLRTVAPNHAAVSTSTGSAPMEANGTTVSPVSLPGASGPIRPHLDLLLLSASDGRDTLVDLTRTLTEMAQSNKLSPKDITSDLINTEISATTSVLPPTPPRSPVLRPETSVRPAGKDSDIGPGEPDLLIVFAPIVQLDGYPPWQIRLTEIFCVGDSGGDVSGRSATRVEYQAFLRGLWRYAGAQMRFGR